MGFRKWLAGDATELGAQDRIDELRKGKPLSNSWSGHTIKKVMLSNPSALDNFVQTYRVGSEQQAQAIRNAKEIFRADSQRSMEKGNVMANNFEKQAHCWDVVALNLEEFATMSQSCFDQFSEDIDAVIRKGVLEDFHSSLKFVSSGYETQMDSLRDTIKSHVEFSELTAQKLRNL